MAMSGIEASSTIQMIVVLIASALYPATYFSFVHLLRYPRNWYSFSLPECLATAVMAALTVTLVSQSPDGIDRPSLVIMVGFFIVLFYIIAAPAIAFQPASRSVEFLAKHGGYAGLWLLVAAIFDHGTNSHPKCAEWKNFYACGIGKSIDAQCPGWVKSRRFSIAVRMSAFGGKAEITGGIRT